jgi:rRNA-processing protein EBP2
MAKRKSNGGKKQIKTPEKAEERVTLEALEAMSDSDDEDIPASQMNTKAKNLRQAISDGKFDHLLKSLKKSNEDDDDEEFEEASLHSSSSDAEDKPETRKRSKKEVEEAVGDSDEEMEDQEEEAESGGEEEEEQADKSGDDEEEEDSDEESEDEEDEKARRMKANNQNNSKALTVVVAELVKAHAGLPWAETFDIIPPTPLPFGEKGDPEHNPLDIHDDLKREVAFYNTALEAVNEARTRCKEAGIPFSRPDDFFAEMVKNDGTLAESKF